MTKFAEKVAQLSPKKLALLCMELQSELDSIKGLKTEPIAIIGMGCRFPGGAINPEAFWRLLRDRVNAITQVPFERWDIDTFYDPDPEQPNKMYTRYGGFLEQVDQFDPQFFGISPREAVGMDPQQRLLLEVSWEALEYAGWSPDKLVGSKTGVFIGIGIDDYAKTQIKTCVPIDAYTGTGNAFCFAAGRLSYILGLQGPSIAIDTACSTSLVTVHLACQSLRLGECNIALAGGVNLMLSPEATIFLSKARALSADGRCKTFDANADGYGRGEGCGMVVLKRLKDAVADGDNILAVIRGSAVNHDGPSSGLTVPNGVAQQAVIRQALANAKVQPSHVSYVEAHGTGTLLGDPLEMRALQEVLGQGRSQDQPLLIGSVKTNIGHLEVAAGVASLIKVVLALQNEEIPPHLHFSQVNPLISLDEIPARIPTERIPWPAAGSRRLAGISSFGLSGTNAHVILEEAPALTETANQVERPLHLLTLSAKSKNALQSLARRYQAFLPSHPEASLADVCFTANTGRSHFTHRLAIATKSTKQLCEQLGAFAAGSQIAGLVSGQVGNGNCPKIAFLFTGQGSQYVGMGYQLYESQPTFRQTLDRCDAILRPYLEQPLLKVLYPAIGETSPLDETAYTQPALFALEYALFQLWQSWGIEPAAVMGHSVGEYVAACVAGVFSLEDGLKLIAQRALLMQSLPQDGEMVAVFADEAQVVATIQPYAAEVAIAAINSPENIVISGQCHAVQAAIAALEAQGIKTRKLKVSHAFHSPLMEPILAEFERIAAQVAYSQPRIRLISNVTGELATAEIATPEYWCRHLRQPVRFATSIQTLHQQGYQVFVELGPKPTLLGMGRNCLPEEVGVWLPSLRLGQSDWQQLLESLGTLYVRGLPVDWCGFDQDYSRRRVVLPTYPFQRQRYWIEMAEARKLSSVVKGHKDYQDSILSLLVEGDIELFAQKLEMVEQLSEDEAKSLLKKLS